MLIKETVLNKVEILPETGHIQVRYATRVLEDGVPISSDTYHRTSFAPGDPIPKDVDALVHGVSAMVWTPQVIAAEQARVTALDVGATTVMPATELASATTTPA